MAATGTTETETAWRPSCWRLMASFPTSATITPTYGVQKRSRPNVRTVRFDDGYEQRLTVGLNQNPKTFQLTFEVSETDADTIETP